MYTTQVANEQAITVQGAATIGAPRYPAPPPACGVKKARPVDLGFPAGAKIHQTLPNVILPEHEGKARSCEIRNIKYMQQLSLHGSLIISVNGQQALSSPASCLQNSLPLTGLRVVGATGESPKPPGLGLLPDFPPRLGGGLPERLLRQ